MLVEFKQAHWDDENQRHVLMSYKFSDEKENGRKNVECIVALYPRDSKDWVDISRNRNISHENSMILMQYYDLDSGEKYEEVEVSSVMEYLDLAMLDEESCCGFSEQIIYGDFNNEMPFSKIDPLDKH